MHQTQGVALRDWIEYWVKYNKAPSFTPSCIIGLLSSLHSGFKSWLILVNSSWTANGLAICQWKKKTLVLNPGDWRFLGYFSRNLKTKANKAQIIQLWANLGKRPLTTWISHRIFTCHGIFTQVKDIYIYTDQSSVFILCYTFTY